MQIDFDREMMHRALTQAGIAALHGEVPVGAVVVGKDGTILAEAGNCCIVDSDPSGHAEMRAIRQASQKLGNYRLPGTTVYVTLRAGRWYLNTGLAMTACSTMLLL